MNLTCNLANGVSIVPEVTFAALGNEMTDVTKRGMEIPRECLSNMNFSFFIKESLFNKDSLL